MKKVLMLLANGVEPLEMAAFTDVMGWATLLGSEEIQVVNAGLREEITTTFGLTLKPSFQIAELDLNAFDALAIPGGFEPSGFYDEALSSSFLDVIQEFDQKNKVIASVCVSSIALGEAGILRGRSATTYHQVGGKRKAQLEKTGAIFVDKPVVCDGNCITSTGPGTALEVAFELLARLTSRKNVNSLRQKMRVPEPSKKWFEQPQVSEGL